ncbi:MAG: GNAT family N-acetyltransferase [Chthoniobacterales bacterium]|nr:GNAT family N-acetyltransferase [Chthoniobacterales bacterium]
MQIRPMVEADAETVAKLAVELGYPNDAQTIDERIAIIRRSDLLLVAVTPTNTPVAFIQANRSCIIEIGFRVEIVGLVVSAKARRGGIGRRLVAAMEQWAKEIGAEAVVVRSNTQRDESHIFYPAMGYGAVKTQAVYEKHLRQASART